MASLTELLGVLLGSGQAQPGNALSMLGPRPTEEPRPWMVDPLTGHPYMQEPWMREDVAAPAYNPVEDIAGGLAAGALSPAGIASINNPRGHLGDLLVHQDVDVPQSGLLRLWDAIQQVVERFPYTSKVPKSTAVVPRYIMSSPTATGETLMQWSDPLFRPRIRLPENYVSTADPSSLVNTLSHELLHSAQKDLVRRFPGYRELVQNMTPEERFMFMEAHSYPRGYMEGLRTSLTMKPYNVPKEELRNLRTPALQKIKSDILGARRERRRASLGDEEAGRFFEWLDQEFAAGRKEPVKK